jgi:cytochrome b6-f complex iron-sulfur subunit
MSGSTIVTVGIAALVVLAAVALFGASRRRDARHALSRETVKKDRSDSPFLPEGPTAADVERAARQRLTATGTELEPVADSAPVPYVPVDPETLGVTRRQFFNRSMTGMMVLSISGFGASMLAFLWPGLKAGGFGGKIAAGKLADIEAEISSTRQPKYYPSGRFYLTTYPKASLEKAKKAYKGELPGMEAGLVALYQKCVHLGCRVPFCTTSQWFECGCHGSQYNRVGEKKGGPAPRGLDRFPIDASGGSVTVDTNPATLIIGPAIGTNTTGQEAEGPHCVNVKAKH